MKFKTAIDLWLQRRRRARAMRNIRETMSFFGCDLDDMSDEDLERGALEFAKIGANMGVTAEEFYEAMRGAGFFGALATPNIHFRQNMDALRRELE